MTQKESIIKSLTQTKTMTQGDLSVALYGDRNHLPNIYMSLMDLVKKGLVVRFGDHPAYYILSENRDNLLALKNNTEDLAVPSHKETINVPKPSIDQVKHWIHEWDSLEDYVLKKKLLIDYFEAIQP